MSTEIFYGYFGAGKTTKMLEKIKEAAEKGEECILFVPEQFSFDAERSVYFAVGARNISHVKVTGFSKLSREILTLYKAARPCADKAVKLVTMWKVIDEVKADSMFKGQASADFCKLALKTVSAFKNAGISPKEYRNFLSEEKELDAELSQKANFFLDIYEKYNNILTENLDDNLDDVSRAAELAEKHGYFKGFKLFFDNFDTFSSVQLKLITSALKQCGNAVFCLSSDSLQSRNREFLCINKTIEKIKEIDLDTKFHKFSRSYREESRDEEPVKVYSVKTPYDEAELIAAKIHKGVMEEGKRYRDYLILTADSDSRDITADRLKCSGIPVFCDFPVSMTEKPLVNFIISALKACSLETEDILTLTEFGLLRQKFLAENKDGKKSTKRHKKVFMNDAYNLRCAAESYDIGPKDWEKGFENDPRQELARLEKLREGIIDPLLELRNSLENADDGAELSRKFMIWLLNKQDMLSSLKGMSTRNDGDKDHLWRVDKELLEEAKRIWNAVCEVFTSMAYCLDGKKIGIEDYRLLLEGILSEINLANPPQVLDCVTVGDIERTRKSSPKTVIIAGFSDKNIPRSPGLESIFTDSEREKLNVSGLSIYDKKLDRCSKEYYFAKRAMELYEKDLILTYSYQDVNGHETERSGILSSDEYKSLEEKSELGDDFFINTAYDLRSAVSRYYNEDREKAEKLDKILQELNNSGEYSEKVSDALTLLNGGRRFSLDKGTACALLGGKKYSPTSLESMFECPFMYFGKYGLGLSENSSKDIAAANNKGTVIHSILHSVLTQYPGSDLADKLQYDPDTGIMNNDEIKKIAAEAVKREAFNNIANDPTFPERTKALFNAMLPSITNILTQMALELRMGKYRPAELEKKVRYNIYDNDLPESENGHITIEGFADRIDLYTEGDKEYVRIFDYKSGKKIKTFSIDDLEYGANLQMLLYLFAECRKNEEAQDENTSSDENASEKKQRLPGEIGYFSTGTAKIYRADGSAVGSQKAINEEWYDSHPINGAVFGNDYSGNAESYNAAVNKLSGKKENFSAEKLYADKFEELKDYVENDVIVKKVRSLLDGNIEAMPRKKTKDSPCTYCSLKSICGRREETEPQEENEKNKSMDKFRIPKPQKPKAEKGSKKGSQKGSEGQK